MFAIAGKRLRETWMVTAVFAAALFGFHVLLMGILPSFQGEMLELIDRLAFIRDIMTSLLGSDLGEVISPKSLLAVPWVHPVLLTLLWTHAITSCTRMPAGEVDRGTIDFLLSLPVTRSRVYFGETLTFFVGGMILILFGLIGNMVGGSLAEVDDGVSLAVRLAISLNLWAIYSLVGSVAMLASASFSRRGHAVAAVSAILVTSFLISSLAAFHEALGRISFLGILTYFRPLRSVLHATWPVADIAILLVASLLCWTAGWIVFVRRDIRTV